MLTKHTIILCQDSLDESSSRTLPQLELCSQSARSSAFVGGQTEKLVTSQLHTYYQNCVVGTTVRGVLNVPNFRAEFPKFRICGTCTEALFQKVFEKLERSRARKFGASSFQFFHISFDLSKCNREGPPRQNRERSTPTKVSCDRGRGMGD